MPLLDTPDDPQGRLWTWQMNAWLVIFLIVALIISILYVVQDRRPLPEPIEPPLEELLEEPLPTSTYRTTPRTRYGITMSLIIFDSTIDELTTLLEEGTRASARSVQRFIEPMSGTLRSAQTRWHHIVFGRRGSGKSSLLFKTADALDKKGAPVAYIDLEPFKGHHYPDVLISVLLATFTKINAWLKDQGSFRGPRTWRTLWLKERKTEKSELKVELTKLLKETIITLRHELHLPDAAELVETRTSGREDTDSRTAKGRLQVYESSLEAGIASHAKLSETQETREQHKRSKIDLLHRSILDYHRIFDLLSKLTEEDCFLFLDDLYHIARGDQAMLLDYFHRIAKGHKLWLKIGTIKHRSTYYVRSPQPLGLKIGDDADDINLDLTLEKFSTTRGFMREVAKTYLSEAHAPPLRDLITDGGLDRLVMASGGVARDFLGILRGAIVETRERLTRNPDHPRGGKIGAEDVNMATGIYGDRKQDEFKKDTLEDQTRLAEAYDQIRIFCLEKTKANVFLIDQETTTKGSDLVQELIDLRLIHHVKSRVTVRARPGRVYRALLLDVSQYTGERKRRKLDMLEFWKEDRDILRHVKLIYDPSISLGELRNQIEQNQNAPDATPAPEVDEGQYDMFKQKDGGTGGPGGGDPDPPPNAD